MALGEGLRKAAVVGKKEQRNKDTKEGRKEEGGGNTIGQRRGRGREGAGGGGRGLIECEWSVLGEGGGWGRRVYGLYIYIYICMYAHI